MKRAKEIFEEELSGEPLTQESVIEAIKIVQLEAIEETCKVCAENARIKQERGIFCQYVKTISIDKESILNCIEILKKEIE